MKFEHYLDEYAAQLAACDDLYARYRRLYDDPKHCEPMFIVQTPLHDLPSWEERLADPWVMLQAEFDQLRPHLEIEDDRVPTVRVQFGTAQVAAAFGCAITQPPNSLPAAANHVLKRAEDVYAMEKPDINAGWYEKLWAWQALWLETLPEGVHIQHPDIQSAFNSAHLIRGNAILTDFYDDPVALDALLDLVTDFMIDVTRHAKAMISDDPTWFFDWGALWRGTARISNCSIHMIRPSFYRDHVFARDRRFFEAVKGGRVHYCGSPDAVINDFFSVPLISGLDYDFQYHDLWSLSERAPENVTLLQSAHGQTLRRLLDGDWPNKRNIILMVSAPSVEAGRDLLSALRASVPATAS
jgi:hypothetical protein